MLAAGPKGPKASLPRVEVIVDSLKKASRAFRAIYDRLSQPLPLKHPDDLPISTGQIIMLQPRFPARRNGCALQSQQLLAPQMIDPLPHRVR